MFQRPRVKCPNDPKPLPTAGRGLFSHLIRRAGSNSSKADGSREEVVGGGVEPSQRPKAAHSRRRRFFFADLQCRARINGSRRCDSAGRYRLMDGNSSSFCAMCPTCRAAGPWAAVPVDTFRFPAFAVAVGSDGGHQRGKKYARSAPSHKLMRTGTPVALRPPSQASAGVRWPIPECGRAKL